MVQRIAICRAITVSVCMHPDDLRDHFSIALMVSCACMQLAASPLTAQFTGMSDLLKSFSPAAVQQFMPLLDQLQPLYMNLAKGEQEFVPHPDETRTLVRGCYGELAWIGQSQHDISSIALACSCIVMSLCS